MSQNQEVREKKRKRKSESMNDIHKEIPGSLALAVFPSESVGSIQTKRATVTASAATEKWQVHFSRFFTCPPPPITSTNPDLVPLHPRFRKRLWRVGNWISCSSSSSSLLQLARDDSSSDVILTVCFDSTILEEHYVSKLQFAWPQVSCMSGFPSRGTRAVFVRYTDSLGQIQKFGLQFLSLQEVEKFMNAIKEICKEGKDIDPDNTDVVSEISLQSELTTSNTTSNQPCKDSTTMTPVQSQTYTPQISPSLLNNEAEQYSHTQEFTSIDNFQSNFSALPPSFTSFLSNCGPVAEQVATQPTASQEVDLKSQITKYMEDASFQDMLFKVEKVISEIGVDLAL